MEFSILVVFATFLLGSVLGSNHTENFSGELSSHPLVNGKHQIVIELMVVNDFDFSALFEHNPEKLVNYWTALLWDVHLKFRMLPNVQLSFRVNSILSLEDKLANGFVEKSRLEDGTLNFTTALSGFEDWLYDKAVAEHITSYDVAIAAIGSAFSGGYLGGANEGYACSVDILHRKVDSALVLSMKNVHLASTLAHELGHLIGAPHDTDEEYNQTTCAPFNATRDQYLMAYDSENKLWEYFFSPCSQHQIENFLTKKQADCLRTLSTEADPIINTAVQCSQPSFTGGISIEDQCKLLVNNQAAYILPNDSNCLEVRCHMDLANGMFSTFKKFDPLDGSVCQNVEGHGQCFLGSCVRPGGHLVNAATASCVGNLEPLTVNGNASMYECLNGASITPLDLIRLHVVDNSTVKIAMLYSTINGNETGEKCLSLDDSQNGLVTFENCSSKSTTLLWELENVQKNQHFQFQQLDLKVEEVYEFVVYHPLTQSCLTVQENSTELSVATNCSVQNSSQRWKYFGESVMQKVSTCDKVSKPFSTLNSGTSNLSVSMFSGAQLIFYFIILTNSLI